MNALKNLQPEGIWKFFEEICQIPRPSKKEARIIDYLMRFGKDRQLETRVDHAGNVLISKPASPGWEGVKPVILQSHMDMVCEKNSDVVHNFDQDPIVPQVVGAWVKARGTTLGGDDGIGMAAQLALLDASDLVHGPVECLFTVDEETGLTGAFELKEGFFQSNILLNLDSEDEGELFIGCAGGIDTTAELDFSPESVPPGYMGVRLSVTGLKGGHSGDDIDKGLGNANKILNRFLWIAARDFEIRLADFSGGNLRNAIAREAFALIALPEKWLPALEQAFVKFGQDVSFEFLSTEPGLDFAFRKVEPPAQVMDSNSQAQLLNALYACPHGVIAMSQVIPGLVETSTNLAAVRFIENHSIKVTTSQRSSIESSKKDIASMVESVFVLAGARVTHGDGYPGWAPNSQSEILQISVEAYRKLFATEPKVRAIHAGLECGLFLEKYPGLDMISFGPTIKGAHSPDERLEIESVTKFWDLLLEILRNIPRN